jgi:hypothetical protein
MKAYGGVDVYIHSFLTSTLDGMTGRLLAHNALHPGKSFQVAIECGKKGAGWDPEPVRTFWGSKTK